jgi:hypothetical protein
MFLSCAERRMWRRVSLTMWEQSRSHGIERLILQMVLSCAEMRRRRRVSLTLWEAEQISGD